MQSRALFLVTKFAWKLTRFQLIEKAWIDFIHFNILIKVAKILRRLQSHSIKEIQYRTFFSKEILGKITVLMDSIRFIKWIEWSKNQNSKSEIMHTYQIHAILKLLNPSQSSKSYGQRCLLEVKHASDLRETWTKPAPNETCTEWDWQKWDMLQTRTWNLDMKPGPGMHKEPPGTFMTFVLFVNYFLL